MENKRVVIGGFLGLLPAGGVSWDYLQYPLGFAELGWEVYYIEDTRLWPVYQREGADPADCSDTVAHLSRVMDAFGLSRRWAYRDEASGDSYGLSETAIEEICRTADLFVNVSCSTFMRDEYLQIPIRMLIDSDPMFTQMQYETSSGFTAGDSSVRDLLSAHTHHFTFGENVGADDCSMPNCGVSWIPTRQPICLSRWLPGELPSSKDLGFTTVMNWTAARDLEFEGRTWGQKNVEFMKVLSLPQRVPEISLSVAVGQTTGTAFPRAEAIRHGWNVLDPQAVAADWRTYRRFIYESEGEFSVAKNTYVQANTGWFSCRSACYLAAGKPVVTQETGWTRHLPSGEGLFGFSDCQQAAEALGIVSADRGKHGKAARRIAEEFFDCKRVLGQMLRKAGG